MTEPICRDLRAGGRDDDWRDIPCGHPATTTYEDRPVCQGHREAYERREVEVIAETFFDGVDIETLRRVAEAGGLKATLASLGKLMAFLQDVPGDRLAEIDASGGLTGLLRSHGRLIEASRVALPHLARTFDKGYRAVVDAYNEATLFHPGGTE